MKCAQCKRSRSPELWEHKGDEVLSPAWAHQDRAVGREKLEPAHKGYTGASWVRYRKREQGVAGRRLLSKAGRARSDGGEGGWRNMTDLRCLGLGLSPDQSWALQSQERILKEGEWVWSAVWRMGWRWAKLDIGTQLGDSREGLAFWRQRGVEQMYSSYRPSRLWW